MPCMEWLEEYSVKVKEIDDQHKKLIDMINELYQASKEYRGQDVQKAVIDKILDYATTHFETEENYMRMFKFPGYEEHKSEHEKFTAKALDLQKRSREEGFILSLEILKFLRDWLADHLIGTDKKYVDFFQEHGLK